MVGVGFHEGGREMTSIPDTVDVARTSASETAAPTVVFIHGFLDDRTVWDDVIASLGDRVNTVTYDLPGFGTRARSVADPSGLSLEAIAAEAGEIVEEIGTPVVVVGQSMGSQVAELVASAHDEQVVGLVLLTPVPLGGTRLPAVEVEPFRTPADDVVAQRTARSLLSPRLDEYQLDRLVCAGAQAMPDVVARYVDIWNDGVGDAPPVSEYTGPVLMIHGGADAFVTQDLVDTMVPRFPEARVDVIDGGGHWLHVEYPGEVASAIAEFTNAIVGDDQAAGWRDAFADQSQSSFADEFADDIVLEASTLAKPIVGRQQVSAVMAQASSIYESLEFTAEAHSGSTTYLQWRATAFAGMEIKGVTILDRDASGKIVAAAIHHRSLAAVLRFSAEIRDRLDGVVAAEHFLKEAS
jgi:pimeloyl-ACP methyl ester carboxylesterase